MRMVKNGPIYAVFDSCKIKGKRHYSRPQSDDITHTILPCSYPYKTSKNIKKS